MSDKVDNTVREVEAGHNITKAVNDGMSREEQLDFARQLWDNGGTAQARQGSKELSKIVGDAEVSFRMGKDGQREVSDIVFKGTADLYDTSEQARAKAQSAGDRHSTGKPTGGGFGAPDDMRYRGPLPGSEAKPDGSTANPDRIMQRLKDQRVQVGNFNVHEKKALKDLENGN